MSDPRWILLAEDNANDADLAMRALSANQSPDQVVLARDGTEALDCLYRRGAFRSRSDGAPALVLLDLKMPKVDGLEVLRKIKSDRYVKADSCGRLHFVPGSKPDISSRCAPNRAKRMPTWSSRSVFRNLLASSGA